MPFETLEVLLMSQDAQEPAIDLREYLRIGKSAELLAVSAETLRNWERAGKLKVIRHPVNGYRLFCRKEILQLLASVAEPSGSRE
jgi:hypothetical protein